MRLKNEEDAHQKELRNLSESSGLGEYNLIVAGLEEFKEALKNLPPKTKTASDLQVTCSLYCGGE